MSAIPPQTGLNSVPPLQPADSSIPTAAIGRDRHVRTFEVAKPIATSTTAPRVEANAPITSCEQSRIDLIRSGLQEGLSHEAIIERIVGRELDQQFGADGSTILTSEMRQRVVDEFKSDPALQLLVHRLIDEASRP